MIIRNCNGVTFLHLVIGFENLHHTLKQSDAKLKTILTWSLVFSCVSSGLLVFNLVIMFILFLICCCDRFGFGFSDPHWKRLHMNFQLVTNKTLFVRSQFSPREKK